MIQTKDCLKNYRKYLPLARMKNRLETKVEVNTLHNNFGHITSGLAERIKLSLDLLMASLACRHLFDPTAFSFKRSFPFLKLDYMYNDTLKIDLQVTCTNYTCGYQVLNTVLTARGSIYKTNSQCTR